jgi:hypothetical protein
MPHRRAVVLKALPGGAGLGPAMAGIGMRVAVEPAPAPPIEETLVGASIEGMDPGRGDLRVLSVLCTWLGVHVGAVNVDRLTRLVQAVAMPRVQAFWAGVAGWQRRDPRFTRLARLHRDARVDLLPVGTDFQVRRHGEDERFAGSPLRVPSNTLTGRPGDVMLPEELARSHRGYRMRLIIGPTYRADLWAALDEDGGLTVAELARRAGSAYAAAWQARRSWEIVRAADAGVGAAA